MQFLNSSFFLPIQNTKKLSSFIVYTKSTLLEALYDHVKETDIKYYLFIQPLSYSMKLLSGTVDLVYELLKDNEGMEDNNGDVFADVFESYHT